MRSGGEYFSEPAEAAQRRYEALRYYFVEEARAEQVAARFGYSPATVHQLAAELRAGRTSFFRSTKPGPKGPRKTRTVRDRVLVLRAEDQSVTEIANALTAQGSPVSAHTVWADTGLPCAVKALAISVTDWSSARRTSTRSRRGLVLRGPLGPGLVERKKLVRPARSSAASWCTVAGE